MESRSEVWQEKESWRAGVEHVRKRRHREQKWSKEGKKETWRAGEE
jgi:hypothetical protein